MTRCIFALILSFTVSASVQAAMCDKQPLDHVDINLNNRAALQRGAKYFVNYCLSCHSAEYVRYNRVGKDLGLTEEQVKQNLIFTDQKVGEAMIVAMPAHESSDWFGAAPPDLSVVARARGADCLYTYLRSFYLDDQRPAGVNNLVFPGVSMPHVLWKLQGWQKAVYEEVERGGKTEQVIAHLELAKPGELSSEEYDQVARDIVTFLVYLGEPALLQRRQIGIWVIAFLLVFAVIAYLLKKEYWKDVH